MGKKILWDLSITNPLVIRKSCGDLTLLLISFLGGHMKLRKTSGFKMNSVGLQKSGPAVKCLYLHC